MFLSTITYREWPCCLLLLTSIGASACAATNTQQPVSETVSESSGSERSPESDAEDPEELPFEWSKQTAWQPFGEARNKAAEAGRPLMVLFYATWCPSSSEFVSDVLTEEEVVAATQRFAMARVDVDVEPELFKAIGAGVEHLPSVIFFDAKGERLAIESDDGDEARFSYNAGSSDLLRAMSEALVDVGEAPLVLAERPSVEEPKERDPAELERRQPRMKVLMAAFGDACDALKKDDPRRAACMGFALGAISARYDPPDAKEAYAKALAACRGQGDCFSAALVTFWGAAPLPDPDPATALKLVRESCAATKGKDACLLESLLGLVRTDATP